MSQGRGRSVAVELTDDCWTLRASPRGEYAGVRSCCGSRKPRCELHKRWAGRMLMLVVTRMMCAVAAGQ